LRVPLNEGKRIGLTTQKTARIRISRFAIKAKKRFSKRKGVQGGGKRAVQNTKGTRVESAKLQNGERIIEELGAELGNFGMKRGEGPISCGLESKE